MAVVLKPWSCLGGENTAILYFDSARECPPLASSSLFARVIVELDVTRCQRPVSDPVDVEFVKDVERWIQFVTVKVSQPPNARCLER